MSFNLRFFVAVRDRGGPRVTWVLLVALIAVLALMTQPYAAMAQRQANSALNAGSSSGQLGLLDVVVLVDESGSETPAKIADEKATTLEIAESMLSQQSRVTVVGFGGVNNVKPDQDPTDPICRPTIASPANYGYLTSCVNGLHQRTEAEGDDTDYAAALGQAMTYLNPNTAYGQQSPAGAKKVILMMTDGAVDVHRNTQQYGTTWQLGEQTAINEQLSTAKQDNVQFWGLGFGTDIGTNVDGTLITKAAALKYLNTMAAQGAPAICDGRLAAVQPNARWVDDPDAVFLTLGQLSADASCSARIFKTTTVGRGVTVDIPDYASSGVITVDRGNPAVQVTFVQPDGQSWTDSSALSGQDSAAVESLHLPNLTSGEVGNWTVKLSAPAQYNSQVVHVSAFWQGAVRAVISPNPTSAKLGQTVCSELSLEGPRGPLSDTADVSDLQVGITVSGDGLSQPVAVTNVGSPSCPTSGPGTYSGTVTAPSKAGDLTFTGIATGYGINTTYVPATVTVGNVAPPFTAVIQYPADQAGLQVQAGSELPLTAVFTNDTGSAQQVRLSVSGSGTSPSIGGTSSVLTVGASKKVQFTVDFPSDSRQGLTGVQVTAANAKSGQVLATASFDATVTKPPGFWAKYEWYFIGAIIALILLLVLWRWRRAVHEWRMDVRGLAAHLRRDGAQLAQLDAPSRRSESFRFVIQNPDDRSPQLNYEGPGLTYLVRRSGNREVTVTPPGGAQLEDVVLGEQTVPVEGTQLQLAFDEDRRRPRPWWVGRADRGPRRRRPKRSAQQWQQTPREQQPQPGPSVAQETISPAPPTGEQPTSELW